MPDTKRYIKLLHRGIQLPVTLSHLPLYRLERQHRPGRMTKIVDCAVTSGQGIVMIEDQMCTGHD